MMTQLMILIILLKIIVIKINNNNNIDNNDDNEDGKRNNDEILKITIIIDYSFITVTFSIKLLISKEAIAFLIHQIYSVKLGNDLINCKPL